MKNPLHISLLHCPSFSPFLLLLSLILIHHLPLSSIPTDLCRDCPSSWISKNLFLRDLASRINSKSLWFLRFCFVFPVSLIYHCDYGIFGFISFFDFFFILFISWIHWLVLVKKCYSCDLLPFQSCSENRLESFHKKNLRVTFVSVLLLI